MGESNSKWVRKDDLLHQEGKPRGRSVSSGALSEKSTGRGVVAVIGLVLLIVVVALLGGVLAHILHSAGIVAWRLSAWQMLGVSAVLVVLRAIDRAVFGGTTDRIGRDK